MHAIVSMYVAAPMCILAGIRLCVCVHMHVCVTAPLFGYHNAEQLVLQPLWGDHEIEQGHFGGQFGEVVWVPQLGGDVEAEIAGILDHRLPKPDAVHTT